MDKIKTTLLFAILFCSLSLLCSGQSDLQIFKIYDHNGNPVEFNTMIEKLTESDVIFIGEQHNDPVSHYFQLKIVKYFNNKFPGNLKIGLEMFETDDQLKIDEYTSGLISEKSFESETRFWNNYKTDYKPIISFAKENKIPVIATNIPRRYASLVYREGLESLNRLNAAQKTYIAPLPISIDTTLKSYQSLMGKGNLHGQTSSTLYLLESQAIKDATMAVMIANNYMQSEKFIHFNGSYHSDWKEGIIAFLLPLVNNLSTSNLSFIRTENIHSFDPELKNIADFIILVDKDMMTSY